MQKPESKTIYLPGLNGIRAIAALSVVFSHITLSLKSFNLNPFILGTAYDGTPRGLDLAGFGVSIFFALSGFLITYLLQLEKDVAEINIKKFYIRRILRIWPLYYLYLFIVLILIFALGHELNLKSLFCYVFFAANVPFIFKTTILFLSHYWSLGVEEQFYLFWPWFNKKVKSHIVVFIMFLICLLLGTKLILHFFYPGSVLESIIHITRFHCMMIGALGAILYKEKNKAFLQLFDNKIAQLISWIVILLLIINKYHIASVIDNEIICVVTVAVIIGQINIRNRIINLETGVFDFLGKISYGIYIIHPLVIFLFAKILSSIEGADAGKYLLVYSSILLSTILFAFLSYQYFETYFLKLKTKVSIVRSSWTKK